MLIVVHVANYDYHMHMAKLIKIPHVAKLSIALDLKLFAGVSCLHNTNSLSSVGALIQ